MCSSILESGSESYTIDAASNQLTVRAGKNYSYDAAGRLLSDGIRSFGWDALGRLKTVRRNGQEVAGYGYDSQNRRVRKTVGAKTTYYLYDLENRLLAEIAGSGRVLREYVWLGQEPVALREYELRPGLYYYINDHLGTPQRLITGEGTVVWQAAALPFGRTQVQLGTVQNNHRAIADHPNLEEVTIGNVVSASNYLVAYCPKLKKINVPEQWQINTTKNIYMSFKKLKGFRWV